jgi:chromate transporter
MIISFCLSYFLNVNIIYIILSVAVFGMVRTIVKGGRDK